MTETAIKRRNTYSKADLLACGEGRLFEGDARLPKPPMLMFDRITEVNSEGGKYGKGEIIAELDIVPELWFFECHFDGDPVMPGCLGLDSLWQLVGFYLAWSGYTQGKGRALGVGDVKFTGQVLPKNKLVRYHLHIRRLMSSKLKMAIADGTVSVDGREIYTASSLRAGLFENTDNF